MFKTIVSGIVGVVAFSSAAMATCTPPSNGTTADASLLNTYLTCQFAPLSNPSFAGNITLSASNPSISSGGSYISIPHGMYVSGGTFYDATQAQLRGGIHNDTAAYLELDGGTSAHTYVNGSLGVGTATPVSALQVVGNLTMGDGTAGTAYAINTATANGADTDILELAGGGASNDTTRGGFINLFGNEFSYLGLYGDTVISAGQATSGVGGDVLFATDSSNGSMSNPIYRMTITNAGDIGIGTRAPAVALAVVGDIRVGTAGTNGCLENFAGTALTGTCSSDARLKNVVGNVSGVLDKLSNLQLVKFYWNDKAAVTYHNSTTTLNTGFLAQAVEQHFPELVSIDRLGYRQVDYTTLSLYSIEAIKELKAASDSQMAEILSQGAEITALKSRLSDEDRRLSQLEARVAYLQPSSDSRPIRRSASVVNVR